MAEDWDDWYDREIELIAPAEMDDWGNTIGDEPITVPCRIVEGAVITRSPSNEQIIAATTVHCDMQYASLFVPDMEVRYMSPGSPEMKTASVAAVYPSTGDEDLEGLKVELK